jgi:very-short-patch-repair endonuclease
VTKFVARRGGRKQNVEKNAGAHLIRYCSGSTRGEAKTDTCRRETLAGDPGTKLAGLKFRRQHPYGPFILDAFCVQHQLEIEVDGGIHSNPDQIASDNARTEYLTLHGISVLRFTNSQVLDHIDEVLHDILEAVNS